MAAHQVNGAVHDRGLRVTPSLELPLREQVPVHRVARAPDVVHVFVVADAAYQLDLVVHDYAGVCLPRKGLFGFDFRPVLAVARLQDARESAEVVLVFAETSHHLHFIFEYEAAVWWPVTEFSVASDHFPFEAIWCPPYVVEVSVISHAPDDLYVIFED